MEEEKVAGASAEAEDPEVAEAGALAAGVKEAGGLAAAVPVGAAIGEGRFVLDEQTGYPAGSSRLGLGQNLTERLAASHSMPSTKATPSRHQSAAAP